MRKSVIIVQLINIFALFARAEAALASNSLAVRAALPQEGPPGKGPGKGPGQRPPGPGKGNRTPPPASSPPPPEQPESSTTSTTVEQPPSTSAPPPPPPSTTSEAPPPPPSTTSIPPPPPPSTTSSLPPPPPAASTTAPSQILAPNRPPIFTAQPILDTITATPIIATSDPVSFLSTISSLSFSATIPSTTSLPSPLPELNSEATSSTPSLSTSSKTIVIVAPTSSTAPFYPQKPPGAPIMADAGSKQTLVIVLSVVLGSIVLLLCTLAFFLFGRCRQRRMKKRGVTPINDEEIETWRSTEKKMPLTLNTRSVELNRTGTLIALSPESDRGAIPCSPDWGWTWSAAQPIQSPPPTRSRGPSIVASMPNARIGLTTDTVPGAEPYVPAHSRQSSRFSKDRKHDRSRSMRSSASAKSMRSLNGEGVTGFDFTMNNEAYMPWLSYTNRESTIGGSTPKSSIYVASTESGGLSPRTRGPPQLEPLVIPTALSPRPEQRQFQSTQGPLVSPSQWPKSWR